MASQTFAGAGFALCVAFEPDTPGLERLYDLQGLSSDDVLRAVQQMRFGQGLSEELPAELMRIKSIDFAGLDAQGSFESGMVDGDEVGLFTQLLERLGPPGWVARQSELVGLRMRALVAGVAGGGALGGLNSLERVLGNDAVERLPTLLGMPSRAAEFSALSLLILTLRWRMVEASLSPVDYALAVQAIADSIGAEHPLAGCLSEALR